MGEKFAVNPVAGAGSMSIPIPTSPGRSGMGPQLSLSYDSRSGNGPFGFGWTLALPSITRKTDKGLPRYEDEVESDVFLLSGVEDLVPVYRQDADGSWVAAHPGYSRDAEDDGAWVRDAAGRLVIHEDTVQGYRVRRYRPRLEGLFSRIERWSKLDTPADVHWRTLSKENTLTIFGGDAESRIADPADPSRIFSWLICETRCDKGNAVVYRYKAEDGTGIDLSAAHERNRGSATDAARAANRYLKRIYYGNRISLLDDQGRRPLFVDKAQIDAQVANRQWLFEVVLDYADHDAASPMPRDDESVDAAGALLFPWGSRPDPFSSYRAGFEIRTRRLCQRVLMFHHFSGTEQSGVGVDCLVRSSDFTYSDEVDPTSAQNPVYTFLRRVDSTGYRRNDDHYDARSLPPLTFEYSEPNVQDKVELLDPDSLENFPVGASGTVSHWIDLHGEGIPGILSEQAGAWFYKRNLSPIAKPADGAEGTTAALAPVEVVMPKPQVSLAGGARFMDLAGDGQLDVVSLDGPVRGFYEHDDGEGWQSLRPFRFEPNRDMRDPNLRLLDLDGDGHADVLITEDDAFFWHPSLEEEGFGPARRASQARDEEKGPRVIFADGTQSIYLADLSGDGLTDLVRIRNGEVCYWPNLGYGRFGAKVTMDHAPHFDHPDQFDQKRIRLADIDGSGTTDLIYLHRDGVRLYFNQSGNSWSEPSTLKVFPRVDDLVSIAPVDLLGNGTACLVWSSPLLGDASQPLRYVNLMGAQKPHLLTKVLNNLGGETRVVYAPSTKFYLQDRRDGKPWITKLPFPVHVVEQVETYDHVARNRFVTRYVYHHGYFDGTEREFRGFGMVEQLDTEAFEDYVVGVESSDGTQALAPELLQPPVTIRTWYHTGAPLRQGRTLHPYSNDYYRHEQLLTDSVLPDAMTAEELQECVRALKGLPLRQEVYSFDGTSQQQDPYAVAENNFEVRLLQAKGLQRHCVLFSVARESISLHYERNPADPRITHSFRLDVDEVGNVHKSCSVTYPRKTADPSLPDDAAADQQRQFISYREIAYTEDIDRPPPVAAHRLRASYESKSYEITGITPAAATGFLFDEIRDAIAGANPIEYEVTADGVTPQKRLLSLRRALYLNNALNPLPFGQWDSLGLVHQSYTLAFTPAVREAYYGANVTDSELIDAGYVHFAGDDNWWIPTGTVSYPADPRSHFYLPSGSKDPLGLETVGTLDAYDLLLEKVEVKQAAWNTVVAVNDYRVLGPVQLTDPNQNRAAVEHDELGFVIKSALMGKAGAAEGDTLSDPTTRMEYELFNWMNSGKPNFVHTFTREKHGAANPRWQESYAYYNGSGGVAMVKAQAHPGKAFTVAADGTRTEVDADPRWIGNGRTILNNKGNPVKQYEPYFSTTHEYEDEQTLREIGVTPITYYDPLGRVVRTLFPDGTFARAEIGTWLRKTFDANDTVALSQWYVDRGSPDPTTEAEPLNDPPRRAAWLAAKHADTPAIVHFDSLGRPHYTIADYGGGKTAAVRSEADLTGRTYAVYDEEGRKVAGGFVGMAGTAMFGESAERGGRWTFPDVFGAVVKTWDERGRRFRTEYDVLHRAIGSFAKEPGQDELLTSYLVYGDRVANAQTLNLLGTIHQIFDQAGMIRLPALDFKGNPQSVDRVLAKDYQNQLDWSALATQPDYAALQNAANARLEIGEVFTATSQYDALNRPTQVTLPDGTVIVPAYDEANALASLRAQVMGHGSFIEFLKSQEYNAKGQRELALHGNDVYTRYFYDPKSFRLANLLTYQSATDPDTEALQNLTYTYDPSGNVTQIRDDAQETHYFANAVVNAENRYEYDAVYQLVRATGRESAGLGNDNVRTDSDIAFIPQLPHVNDSQAIRTYQEEYEYDLLGNIKSLKHRFQPQPGIGNGWTRHYRYAFEDDATDRTNRLVANSMPGDADAGPYSGTYEYDAYGNMTRMPHLALLDWNVMDQLRHVDLGGGGDAYYACGMNGQRVRKVIERNGDLTQEWIFLGAVTIFRRRRRPTRELRFERWTVHIGDNTGEIAQADTKTRDDDNRDPANPVGTTLIRYQYSNHLGSAVLETDDHGDPISYEEYHPYGTTAYRSARAGFDISLKRYRFSGKERDDESGLYYFGARYYAPWLGRWTSSDPIGCAAGLNLFRYCSNNPVMRRDPDGLDDEAGRRINATANRETIARLNRPDADPREVLRHFQTHGHPELTDAQVPTWDPTVGMWRFPGAGNADASGGSGPPGGSTGGQSGDADRPAGPAAGAVGGTAIRNNPPGRTITVPEQIDDAKLERLREGVRQRTVGMNAGPGNSTSARRNSPAQQAALREFRRQAGGTPPGQNAGHRIDLQYDATGRVGEHPRDYIWEPGGSNQADGRLGYRLIQNEPLRQPSGAVVRPSEAGSVRFSERFRGGMRVGGMGLAAVGTGFSAYGLVQDIRHGDVSMGVGDTLGVVGGGLEIYAGAHAFTAGGATAVGGATVGGIAALPLGIALSGVGLAVVSGISMSRAADRGDSAGVVAGGVGMVAGGALAVGGGIALASAAGVAMAPALIAAAPILIGIGAVLALGVGAYHLGRHFNWW